MDAETEPVSPYHDIATAAEQTYRGPRPTIPVTVRCGKGGPRLRTFKVNLDLLTKWRLHPKWIQNSNFIRFIGEHIDVYFSVNTNQTSASMRWEALKAYIRGQMISFTSSKSNIFKQKMKKLDYKIREL